MHAGAVVFENCRKAIQKCSQRTSRASASSTPVLTTACPCPYCGRNLKTQIGLTSHLRTLRDGISRHYGHIDHDGLTSYKLNICICPHYHRFLTRTLAISILKYNVSKLIMKDCAILNASCVVTVICHFFCSRVSFYSHTSVF